MGAGDFDTIVLHEVQLFPLLLGLMRKEKKGSGVNDAKFYLSCEVMVRQEQQPAG